MQTRCLNRLSTSANLSIISTFLSAMYNSVKTAFIIKHLLQAHNVKMLREREREREMCDEVYLYKESTHGNIYFSYYIHLSMLR